MILVLILLLGSLTKSKNFFFPDERVTHLHFRHIQQLNVTNIYVRDTRLTSLAGFWYHR
jgi:hypothetical protein